MYTSKKNINNCILEDGRKIYQKSLNDLNEVKLLMNLPLPLMMFMSNVSCKYFLVLEETR